MTARPIAIPPSLPSGPLREAWPRMVEAVRAAAEGREFDAALAEMGDRVTCPRCGKVVAGARGLAVHWGHAHGRRSKP